MLNKETEKKKKRDKTGWKFLDGKYLWSLCLNILLLVPKPFIDQSIISNSNNREH